LEDDLEDRPQVLHDFSEKSCVFVTEAAPRVEPRHPHWVCVTNFAGVTQKIVARVASWMHLALDRLCLHRDTVCPAGTSATRRKAQTTCVRWSAPRRRCACV